MENTENTTKVISNYTNKAGLYLLKMKLADGSEAIKLGYSLNVNKRFTDFELKPIVTLLIDNEERALNFLYEIRSNYAKYEVVKNWYSIKYARMIGIEIYNEFGYILDEKHYV